MSRVVKPSASRAVKSQSFPSGRSSPEVCPSAAFAAGRDCQPILSTDSSACRRCPVTFRFLRCNRNCGSPNTRGSARNPRPWVMMLIGFGGLGYAAIVEHA